MANKVWWFPPADDVQPDEQNGMYQNSDYLLTSYFPIQPCICSGLAYTQTDTSNVITFTQGVVRWQDQLMGFTGLGYTDTYAPTVQAAFCDITANTYTITAGASVDQLYIVAVLTITINTLHANITTGVCPETFVADLTATISDTAMTLAEIGSSTTIVPLYTITNNVGVYTIGIDEYCIHNYGLVIDPTVSTPVEITTNTTLTQTLNNVIATGTADLQVNMPTVGSLSQPYPPFTITNQTATNAITVNGNSTPIGTPDYTSVTIVIQRGSSITLELVAGISPFTGGYYWRIVDSFINQPDIVDVPGVGVTIGDVPTLVHGTFTNDNVVRARFNNATPLSAGTDQDVVVRADLNSVIATIPKIQSGSGTVFVRASGGSGSGTVTISFPTSFSSTPSVCITLQDGVIGSYGTQNTLTTSFVVIVTVPGLISSYNQNFAWIAVT